MKSLVAQDGDRRGGHILALVMVGLAAVGLLLASVSSHLGQQAERRPAEEQRHQALWLARSALATGWTGARVVETPHGSAKVEASPGQVVVTMDRGAATVTSAEERYEAFR